MMIAAGSGSRSGGSVRMPLMVAGAPSVRGGKKGDQSVPGKERLWNSIVSRAAGSGVGEGATVGRGGAGVGGAVAVGAAVWVGVKRRGTASA